MKRKLWMILLALVASFCLCFGLAGCKDTPSDDDTNQTQQGTDDPDSDGDDNSDGQDDDDSQGDDNQGDDNQGDDNQDDDNQGGSDTPHTHSFTDYVYNNDATCTKDGTETATCSCGVSDTRTKTGSALGHSFVGYVYNDDATCTKNGTETAKCARCDEKNTREKVFSSLGHSYTVKNECDRCHEPLAFTPGLKYEDGTEENTLTLAGVGDWDGNGALVIPCEVDGKIVTAIKDKAFNKKSGITSLVIPNSVKTIGKQAFTSCTGISGELRLPEGLISVGEDSFQKCTNVTTLVLPTTMTEITKGAFRGSKLINTVYVPSTVKKIHERVFLNLNGLVDVYTDDLKAWCEIEFDHYHSNPLFYASHLYVDGDEVTEIKSSDGITKINAYTLENCSSIKTVSLGDVGEECTIGNSAFYGCLSLESVKIGDGVTVIAPAAFSSCSALKEVSIASSVTLIDTGAFYGCWSLTSVTLPDDVASIGESAFESCTSLREIHLSKNLTSIGYAAFKADTSLESITIPEGVTSIAGDTFFSCSGLESISLPSQLNSIGGNAFFNCSALTEIELPATVTAIGSWAFSNCTGLTEIVLPEQLTAIQDHAFLGCSKLTEIDIPEGLTDIGRWAFEATAFYKEASNWENNVLYLETALIKVRTLLGGSYTVTEGTTVIADGAFEDCTALTGELIIPSSVKSIGPEAFKRAAVTKYTVAELNENYKTSAEGILYDTVAHRLMVAPRTVSGVITIDEGTLSVQKGAFYQCHGLTGIKCNDGLLTIEQEAFYQCGSLGSVEISDSVTTIDHFAFLQCPITSLKIGHGLQTIGVQAFWGCGAIGEVTYNGDIAEWQAISKGANWSDNSGITQIKCNNGNCAPNP